MGLLTNKMVTNVLLLAKLNYTELQKDETAVTNLVVIVGNNKIRAGA